jgi:hypothetical protein
LIFKVEGDAWGVDGELLLDEDGNPEIDEGEELNGADDNEGGWDVSLVVTVRLI